MGVLSKLLILGKLWLKLTWLLGKLLSGLLSKLWLCLRRKLLPRLFGKLLLGLLEKLLLLLKLTEILIEILGVELFRCRPTWVKIGSIEHRTPWSLTPLVCKSLTLSSIISLPSNLFLSFYNSLLVG